MRLFAFQSSKRADLRAFTGDSAGSSLPSQFGPWRQTSVVRDDRKPPHQLERASIEQGIREHGFQLWRLKSAEAKEAAASE